MIKQISKNMQINFRVTLEEKERWKRAAEADGRELSNWIRKILNDNAKEEEGGH